MIKLHLLEKVMKVVNTVSKWAASIKKKHEEKKAYKQIAKANKREKGIGKLRRKGTELGQESMQHKPMEQRTAQLISKAKQMKQIKEMKQVKQMIHFSRYKNVIYLPIFPVWKQRQHLGYRDNVVYIDFKIKMHPREPTNTSCRYYINDT
ncbi:MAG: hypothetical protein RR490_08735 [Niameybacter sp.]